LNRNEIVKGSFMQRVIKRCRVQTGLETTRPSAGVRTAEARHISRGARLIRVDDRLQAIEITCGCGETMIIEIECESPVLSEEPKS
jgi:hypothetical protein